MVNFTGSQILSHPKWASVCIDLPGNVTATSRKPFGDIWTCPGGSGRAGEGAPRSRASLGMGDGARRALAPKLRVWEGAHGI